MRPGIGATKSPCPPGRLCLSPHIQAGKRPAGLGSAQGCTGIQVSGRPVLPYLISRGESTHLAAKGLVLSPTLTWAGGPERWGIGVLGFGRAGSTNLSPSLVFWAPSLGVPQSFSLSSIPSNVPMVHSLLETLGRNCPCHSFPPLSGTLYPK